MIYFFQKSKSHYLAVATERNLENDRINILKWLFSEAEILSSSELKGLFIGPRKEMITPWSTNAVEICENCGIDGIIRIEEFTLASGEEDIDPMLQQRYENLGQDAFTINVSPESIRKITNLHQYNEQEGLALSDDEISFLNKVSDEIGRPLTDSEVFGFSQINSEHCRHKIFNGTFILDGEEQPLTLFQWIKKTAKENPNLIVSAYKDNVAFIKGPPIEQFAPRTQDKPDYFEISDFDSVISLKAETHNFPTTVEPFNGAATGSGGEIRDRLAGGQGSFPLAGTAVYMTSYPRTSGGRKWEGMIKERSWLYQKPKDILIKASNGASDFGNKYGQPMIAGSLLTFEHSESGTTYGFDKVIMLAGGIGFAKLEASKKKSVESGEKVVVLGGDNYRIGMGGGAVSSVATGEFGNSIELNAVQRSNPEMQKRVANAIRAMAEKGVNPVVSIHDHGAGGHLNCLSELVEESGGRFEIEQFPIGDPTLSEKEILSNESQERMGLVIKEEDTNYLKDVAQRERAPYYEVGMTTGDKHLSFSKNGSKPFDLELNHLFGSSPKTVLKDTAIPPSFEGISSEDDAIESSIENVLRLEAVACKDWLTNKVDRSVTGKVATQQTVGEIQLPLNNLGVMALDFKSNKGVATSIGHSPIPGLINSGAGSRLSVAECLTNLVFTPLSNGLKGISLSANWMWPAKNQGENSRLYNAVKELSEFCIQIGVNVPTGKDSLSMTQKYPDGGQVMSPGTVIVSSVSEVSDIRKTVLPALNTDLMDSEILYIDFSGMPLELGGSSYAQSKNQIGVSVPDVDINVFIDSFNAVQQLILEGKIIAGHDVSAGGMITTLLEMNFANSYGGMEIDLSEIGGYGLSQILFSENPALIVQVADRSVESYLRESNVRFKKVGKVQPSRHINLTFKGDNYSLDIDRLRDIWMESSYLLDKDQTRPDLADLRFENYKRQPLNFTFPEKFSGSMEELQIDLDRKSETGIRAAIIREKGVNGDREMAYALWAAGFDVKDVHMTDLVSGRENLEDVNMIVFVGGFSNSDVLGSGKGWAGSFLFNAKAKAALDNFYERDDTLSLGVCNGCQVMMELEKVFPEDSTHPKMHHNGSGKFESSFIGVDILPTNAIMLKNMAGSQLGIWLAHGEGRFVLPKSEVDYSIPVKYSYKEFPGNPNSSDYAAAAVCSRDGRHLAIMPHLERTIFPWNWAHYGDKMEHEISPWIIPFINAKDWIREKTQS